MAYQAASLCRRGLLDRQKRIGGEPEAAYPRSFVRGEHGLEGRARARQAVRALT
jgi:hypothetical protein